MNRIHYPIKSPKYPNDVCQTFSHIDDNGMMIMKDKKKFLTDKEAIAEAKRVNALDKTIHKLVAYKCKKCQYWHIGRTHKLINKNEYI